MSNIKTLEQIPNISKDKSELEKSYEEYEPQFLKLIEIFKRYRIEVTEELCKELSQISLNVFNIGFRAGVTEGISQFEKKLSEKFGV